MKLSARGERLPKIWCFFFFEHTDLFASTTKWEGAEFGKKAAEQKKSYKNLSKRLSCETRDSLLRWMVTFGEICFDSLNSLSRSDERTYDDNRLFRSKVARNAYRQLWKLAVSDNGEVILCLF